MIERGADAAAVSAATRPVRQANHNEERSQSLNMFIEQGAEGKLSVPLCNGIAQTAGFFQNGAKS